MWIILVVVAAALAFVVWRIVVGVRRREPLRPIDSGHPHLTDVDPHDQDDRPPR